MALETKEWSHAQSKLQKNPQNYALIFFSFKFLIYFLLPASSRISHDRVRVVVVVVVVVLFA